MSVKSSSKRSSANQKKEKKPPTTGDIFVFGGFKGNYIALTAGQKTVYVAVLKISGVDYDSFSDDDLLTCYNSFAKATMAVKIPHKYVFSTGKPNLTSQLKYVDYKRNKAPNAFCKALLNREYNRFTRFMREREDRQAYMILSDESTVTLNRAISKYINGIKHITVAQVCSPAETVSFLSRHLQLSSESSEAGIMPYKIKLDENHFVVNESVYATSLIISGYPSYIADFQIANQICNHYPDCVVLMDVQEEKHKEMLKAVKRSVEELNGRSAIKYQKTTDQIDNQADLQDMVELYGNLSRGVEQVISMTLRIVIRASSYKDMINRLNDIRNDLTDANISCFVRYNDMLQEYKALVLPANYIKTAIPLHDTYKKQFPFYDESIYDSTGLYLGESRSGGIVAIDFFNRTVGRESYDIMAFGLKGSGKTVLLKSLMQKRIMLGDKVYAIDIEGEYSQLAAVLGGKVIKFNKQSTINPLQIRQSIVPSVLLSDESVETNFECEVSRIVTFMHEYSPNISDNASEVFRQVLCDVYADFGIDERTDITALPPTSYPTFRDVSDKLNSQLYEDDGITFRSYFSESDKEAYRELVRICNSLSRQIMFGNTTNVDISDDKLVIFDVKALSDMDEKVFNAQLFNIISIMWAEVCNNVAYNKSLLHPFDRRRTICLIDEAHRFISSNNPNVTEFIEKLLRRSRKYDAALWFATQSLADFDPEGSSSDYNCVRKVFNLVQYKIIMKQQSNSFEHLKKAFYQLTDSEIQDTAEFESGQMLILLGSGRYKLHCYNVVAIGDLLYMGNSQDVQEIIREIFDELYYDLDTTDIYNSLTDPEACRYFKEVFYVEVFDYLGFSTDDSEVLSSIVTAGIDNLVSALIRGGGR